MPAIRRPLPRIAVDVVQASWIGIETASRHGAVAINAFASTPGIDVIAVIIGLSRRNGRAHQNGVVVPARAGYSNSASDSSPYGLPVFFAIQLA